MITTSLLATLLLTAPPTEPEIFSPEDCPELFGDDEERLENEAERGERLNFVMDHGQLILIDHSHDWSTPEPIHFEGLELIETSTDGFALLEVETQAAPSCRPGVYAIEVDDGFGAEGRVLGLLNGVVLVEWEDELFYLRTDSRPRLRFSMAWSSDYSVTPYLLKKGSGQSSRRSKLRRNRRNRRRTRKR